MKHIENLINRSRGKEDVEQFYPKANR